MTAAIEAIRRSSGGRSHQATYFSPLEGAAVTGFPSWKTVSVDLFTVVFPANSLAVELAVFIRVDLPRFAKFVYQLDGALHRVGRFCSVPRWFWRRFSGPSESRRRLSSRL